MMPYKNVVNQSQDISSVFKKQNQKKVKKNAEHYKQLVANRFKQGLAQGYLEKKGLRASSTQYGKGKIMLSQKSNLNSNFDKYQSNNGTIM